MAIYVYKCPFCEKALEREFPLGKQPKVLKSFCEKAGKDAKCPRIYKKVDFIMK